MTREIGEVFEYKNLTLMVVESEGCEGCAFYDSFDSNCVGVGGVYRNSHLTGYCGKGLRTDRKPVIFKEVEQ